MGSSSILNLPVLGQENQLQPTNRNLKAIESSKTLFRNEETKIFSTGSPPTTQNPIYYSRSNNASHNGVQALTSSEVILSPIHKKDGGHTTRNINMKSIKKS